MNLCEQNHVGESLRDSQHDGWLRDALAREQSFVCGLTNENDGKFFFWKVWNGKANSRWSW